MTEHPPRQGTGLSAPVFLAVPMLIAIGVRTLTQFDPFPHWELSPFVFDLPMTGLGPAAVLITDLVLLLCALAVIISTWMNDRRLPMVECALWAAGSIVALWYGLASLDHLSPAVTWVAALSVGIAASRLAGSPVARWLCTGIAVGLAAPLASKGLVQVLIENPETVESFRATRDQFFDARGWHPDSAMARAYERRLTQPEATGWYGLANVYGAVAASTGAALLAITFAGWRRSVPRWITAGLTIGAACSLIAVGLSGSKGAILGLVIGLILPLLAVATRRVAARVSRWLGLLVPAGMIVLILARGVIGTQIGELSLLFRWFYISAASRIFVNEPLGCGPGRFKDAYLLHKSPFSPEEATSPHSLFFDWVSTLGVLAFSWVILAVTWSWRAGSNLGEPTTEPATSMPLGLVFRVVLLVVAASGAVATWIESPLITIDGGLARIAGFGGWALIACAVLGLAARRPLSSQPLALAGLVMIALTQIDVAGVWSGSAPLAMLLIGLGAASTAGPRRGPWLAIPMSLTIAVLAVAGVRLPALVKWEAELGSASELARSEASISGRLATVGSEGVPTDSIESISLDLSRMVGRPVSPNPGSIEVALRELQVQSRTAAHRHLVRALTHRPDHQGTRVAATRTLLERAALVSSGPEDLGRALVLAEQGTTERPDSAAAWGWLGTVRFRTGGVSAWPEVRTAWVRAAELDPHGLLFPLRLYEVARQAGDESEARVWARRVLEIDAALRLDPVRQLTDDQRAEIRGFSDD